MGYGPGNRKQGNKREFVESIGYEPRNRETKRGENRKQVTI